MLALVTKSKPVYGNILGYDTKTHEYVYIHKHVEKWRVPQIDASLFNYCNTQRANYECIDPDQIATLTESSIYQKYSDACQNN